MRARPRGFDRLARLYRVLELAAFGRDLERARFRFLDHLRGCTNILILGEGDGRCLERIVRIAPTARIRCVDASRQMLLRAEERVARLGAPARLQFECADARTVPLPDETYDAVLTFFFLDCFRAEDVAGIIERVRRSLRPGGLWLFADFALPDRRWPRLRARLCIDLLYRFFRWQTGIEARSLPPSEEMLRDAGCRRAAVDTWRRGLIRSAVFANTPAGAVNSHA